MGRIPGITASVFLLTAGYLHCQTSDPCESRPCENSGVCGGHGTTNYTCTCIDGYFGKNCEKSVCTTLYRALNNFNLCGVFTSSGVCIGKIANGELCQCPDTHWGPLCNLPTQGENKTLTLCQRQKQLFSTTVKLINDSDFTDNSISLLRTLTDISRLKSVLHEMNLSYLPVRTCTSDGSFAASQCDVSIDDLATWKCYCTETGVALCKVTIGSRTSSNRSCECDCEYWQCIQWKLVDNAKFKHFPVF
ncbi:sushi, nidogen and EGF-like domain-containing protein 1 isoform X2 [Haliotis rubra]|uniref:sushi, nidogen and EGF-like domain-containing protein 1 isoform X2 n=1 Tax=Haliotis rubra TaxID=36100 RepID=UPI001EE5DCE5|nr:sushi, nidogen and EGF-like domain-containing protein 1 isoform X2 [Haliotis rubra]